MGHCDIGAGWVPMLSAQVFCSAQALLSGRMPGSQPFDARRFGRD
jgi:hypothetical protein